MARAHQDHRTWDRDQQRFEKGPFSLAGQQQQQHQQQHRQEEQTSGQSSLPILLPKTSTKASFPKLAMVKSTNRIVRRRVMKINADEIPVNCWEGRRAALPVPGKPRRSKAKGESRKPESESRGAQMKLVGKRDVSCPNSVVLQSCKAEPLLPPSSWALK